MLLPVLWAGPLPEVGLEPINPRAITDPVHNDSDDIKLWVHPDDPALSLLIGTDKDRDGGLHVWNLRGEEQPDKTVRGLRRPNNLDILQGIAGPRGGTIDIVATTERQRHQLRVFQLPDMQPLDGGGIPVYQNAEESPPMGIALWQRPRDGAVYAIVSGKTGPTHNYLRQYQLEWQADGTLAGRELRQFGRFSGVKEIEAIVVDRELGYVYYSDEGVGIRKYHADPDHPAAAEELAFIATDFFAGDVEGLSIYPISTDSAGQPAAAGYIMASDQQANRMHFFRREGTAGNPHQHEWLYSVVISAHASDGNTISSRDLGPLFPAGLMAAMSEGRTFHVYSWDVVAGDQLVVAPDGRAVVDWLWTGAVTSRGARIVAKLGHRDDVFLLVSDEDDMDGALRIAPERLIAVPGGWLAHFALDGLAPATRYYALVERKGRAIRQHPVAFTTFPAGRAPLRVAMGSCAATGSNHPVFDTIRAQQPDLFLHLGDLHYEDIAENEIARFYAAFDRALTAPRQAKLYGSVPVAYVWDDHDYGPNNSDKESPSRAAALAAYQSAVPHYPLHCPDRDSIYQAFSYGRVRFILTDTRSQRSPRRVADGPARTMLGARQLEWLKAELLEASRTHDLVVWVNSVPWMGDDGNYDRWTGFAHERSRLSSFIEEHGIRNLCMVSGDAHMLAIEDGRHNTYGPSGKPLFPILQAAALDRRGSVKGGPYSHGPLPGPGQFGLLEVSYPDASTLKVRLTGMNSSGETLLEHSFELPL